MLSWKNKKLKINNNKLIKPMLQSKKKKSKIINNQN